MGAVCLAVPVCGPASMALVLHSAVDGRCSSVAALARAYGVKPYLPSVDFSGGSNGNTVSGWLVALAAVILAGYFASMLQRCCLRFLRRVGVGALRVLVDVDNGLVATRGYCDRLHRRLGVVFRHLAAYAVVGGLMFTLTTFLVSVAPVGGTPTHRQLNSVALIMDSAPLLSVGEGRLLLDAFTTARYDVSIAMAPSSFVSGIDTLELAESLGLEASVDLSDAREGGWASSISAIPTDSPEILARRQYAHSYKNASLNIWDTGANRGNFVSLKYAEEGTVRDNHIKMSTAAGLY